MIDVGSYKPGPLIIGLFMYLRHKRFIQSPVGDHNIVLPVHMICNQRCIYDQCCPFTCYKEHQVEEEMDSIFW